MRPITRVLRHGLPIVLMLGAAPSTALAQSLVCHPIRRGESATQVARRLTGDGWNAYRPWFQIRNGASRFIPKSQYDRVRPGWQACITGPALRPSDLPDASITSATTSASAEPTAPAAPVATTLESGDAAGDRRPTNASGVVAIESLDLTMIWLGVALVVPWFGWRIVDELLARRKTRTIVMRHFAHRFIAEFERPLVRDDASGRALRSRVRVSAQRGRLDILLAPGRGRRYPNLLDHRNNVEYDVSRVMHALADESFVSGPLHTQSGWVVVPLRFTTGATRLPALDAAAKPRSSGVTCISSF